MTIVTKITTGKLTEAKEEFEERMLGSLIEVLREYKKVIAAQISEGHFPLYATIKDLQTPGQSLKFKPQAVKEPDGPPVKKYWGKQKSFTPNKKPVENPKSPAPKVLVSKNKTNPNA